MLWVYGHYNLFTLLVRGPILDVRFQRLKSVPALKGLMLARRVADGDSDVSSRSEKG